MHKLAGSRFDQADFAIPRYAAMVPSGTTLEDVCHPEFWQNNLNVMRPGMRIDVLSDDFALDAELRVTTVTATTANVRVLRVHSEGAVKQPVTSVDDISDVVVGWGGPKHKFRFIHGGQVIEKGFATEAEARKAADAYIRRLASDAERASGINKISELAQ